MESRFEENKVYVAKKDYMISFKNYKLFDVAFNLINLFGVSNLKLDKNKWEYLDISDEIQFYVEVKMNFSNN